MESLILSKVTRRRAKPKRTVTAQELTKTITDFLDDRKAIDVVVVALGGKSNVADYLVIASGTSQRHISAMADDLALLLKADSGAVCHIEGSPQCDWVLIDVSDVIVHLFRPEVRTFYNLEKMWNTAFDEVKEADTKL